ncbi:MAG TPA: cation:dicarboxylase symporter family transporter, partial [Methylomirabilota bacterium]|nr:cation:dicarboxylase symporter family transporter [Methylomirabilota bacterium]
MAHEPRIEAVAEAGEAPHVVSLPLGSEVAYYLELPAGSRLVLEEIEASGGASGLEVWLEKEGGSGQRVATLAPSSRRQAVALPLAGEGWVRLALRPVAGSARPVAGEIRLEKPEVRAAPRPEPAAPAVAAKGKRPNVLLYLVDTLRADRLGCYGYGRPVSPHLDAFAGRAVLFERAVAQSPWTRPSVASILTGLLPTAHGVQTLEDRLPEAARTLPEILRAAGYRTAALSTNHHVATGTGLAQGFDDFFLDEEHHAEPVVRRAVAWLDRRTAKERPFFLYVHTLDPHAPYQPPAVWRQRFAPGVRPEAGSREDLDRLYRSRGEERAARIAEVSRLYDAEIAAGDEAFGQLLAALRERGLYDDTLIVFVSDHGEELGERGGLGHGHSLYQELLSIPLVVKPAGRQPAGRRSSRLAQQVDLLPTVLAAAGLPLEFVAATIPIGVIADMARTATNVTAAAVSATVVARQT